MYTHVLNDFYVKIIEDGNKITLINDDRVIMIITNIIEYNIVSVKFPRNDMEWRIRLPDPEYATNNAHMFYFVCRNLEERTKLLAYLKENDILAVFHYLSLHLSKYYKDNSSHIPTLPNCDRFADCLVRLPMYYELKERKLKL